MERCVDLSSIRYLLFGAGVREEEARGWHGGWQSQESTAWGAQQLHLAASVLPQIPGRGAGCRHPSTTGRRFAAAAAAVSSSASSNR